jgi:hypothetical protein
MAEQATIMAEEMKPQKKVAFANRKYTNEEKRKMEEEELEQLVKEQKGEVEQEATTEPEESPDRKSLPTQKKKHLKSVTLICVDINSNRLKILRKRLKLLNLNLAKLHRKK